MRSSCQLRALLVCAAVAKALERVRDQSGRAAAGICRRVRVWPACMVEKVGRSGATAGLEGGPAAARSAGWQVGCTPRRAETLRPHTRHRVRLLAESQAAGTSPCRVPARWESMCACKDATDCHPRCRAGSPHKHPSTGQKIRAGRPSSTCMGWECEEPRGRGEWLRRRGRSPPTGVPGEGAMDVSRSGQSRAKPAHQRSQTWVQPGPTMTAAARLPPSTGRSLRAGITSKHLSRVKGKKNSDQLKVPTSTGETATHTGERYCANTCDRNLDTFLQRY